MLPQRGKAAGQTDHRRDDDRPHWAARRLPSDHLRRRPAARRDLPLRPAPVMVAAGRSTPPPSPLRMFYVDDSGAEVTGWATYSWIETTPDGWRTMLRRWLTLRGELYAKFKIPPSVEMHVTKFVAGRSRPSTDDSVSDSRAQRVLATQMMLEAGRGSPRCRHRHRLSPHPCPRQSLPPGEERPLCRADHAPGIGDWLPAASWASSS